MSGGEGCQFCLSYGESKEQSRTHRLRTASGLVSCPILRSLSCPICQATGDFAHTKSYCPLVSMDAVSGESNSNMMKTKNTIEKLPRESGPITWPLPSYQRMMNNYTGTIRYPPPPPPPTFHHQVTTSPLLAQHQQYQEYYR